MSLETEQADKTSELQDEKISDQRYLIFRLQNELYGVKLLDVREVIEPPHVKETPNVKSAFLGICNLRGQIIGVYDLRRYLGHPVEDSGRPVFCIFESEFGTLAAAVDEITSVHSFADSEIDRNPKMLSSVSLEFIVGLTKYQSRIVTLLDVHGILSKENITNLKSSKLIARAANDL